MTAYYITDNKKTCSKIATMSREKVKILFINLTKNIIAYSIVFTMIYLLTAMFLNPELSTSNYWQYALR